MGGVDVTGKLTSQEFSVPGSLLRVNVNNRHPIGYGMMEEAAVMFHNTPAFDLSRGLSVVHYSSEDPLLSGWLNVEQILCLKWIYLG